MTYILYGDKGSGAFAVEAVLAEAGLDYAFSEISLEKEEQRTEEFRALNPSGKVPALKLPSGEIVTETAALMLLIATRHPEANLLPPVESPDYAQALRWLAFMASEVYPPVEIADYPERFVPDHKGAAVLKLAAKRRIRERMEAVEAAASEGPWFFASGFSLVDIYATMFSRWRECRAEGWREAHIPKICAIAAALKERPRLTAVFQKHFWMG
ncbi:glutathione S-transferase [Rhizomicrobium palustre]|uniref:Glutathione S-transferase n=1 Tax=Rhizomicrobium palustre TaxID=189966 RepID=A0A846MXZ3_9PROT|nr:glutathione S-transferase family protein [Rhizomicrobium palustre]NIK88001.1 glutathione S-transferase [Rhizomicrobium palustre]